MEVDTPALQISPGVEPHLGSFETDYVTPRGKKQRLHLCTSPEFSCKKLLVAGMEKIYQLSHVFRNREGGSRHHPEFTMLEWYRVGAGYEALMADCAALLRTASAVTGQRHADFNHVSCDLEAEAEILSVAEAFRRYARIDLLATVDDPLNPSPQKLAEEARRIDVYTADDDRWDDIALRILGERIEPYLGRGRPTFLTDYPLCMAALARPKPDAPHLAERFELYVCGLELANAFVELTDARVQRARFEADAALKKERYGEVAVIDEDFLVALAHGMPQAAGIALGVDRLVMLVTGAQHIEDVLWLPVAGTRE